MKKKQQKKKVNVRTMLGRFFFVGILGYLAFVLISQQFDLASLQTQSGELDEQIAEQQRLQKENESIQQIVGTDEYTEDVARERLGFMKPDEKVFIASSGE